MANRTEDGLSLRIQTLINEYTRECLAHKVARRLRSQDVLKQLGYLFIVDCQVSFDQIMAQSLQQKPSDNGWSD